MRWTRCQLWLLLGLLPSRVWACATCWGADDPFARGLNASILFLMSMPFTIVAVVMGIIFMTYQKSRGRHWSDVVYTLKKRVKRRIT